MSQERFTTSREVYHRIRWDPRLEAREFVIGYDTHGERLEEMPFEAFVPDGEIPWHRVWYFKRGREVVWDRKERIDRLNHLVEPPAEAPAPTPPRPREVPGFARLQVHRYDARAGDWMKSPSSAPGDARLAPERLTVATFNVLFDLYDREKLATEHRTPAALALLRETDADVIVLQEVTAPFLRALLAEGWVRERYHVSDGPEANTVVPYGQVLLSSEPLASVWQRVFSRDKRLIVGELRLAGGPLWVATPHLTSNREATGAAARAVQVQALLEELPSLTGDDDAGVPDVVLAGDFNFGDGDAEVESFRRAGFVDAWPTLRPSEQGETYNPRLNSLAAITTVSGRLQRLDRVLVASPSGRLSPESIELFGEAPLKGARAPSGEPLFASDHFGIRCVLRRDTRAASSVTGAAAARLVHHTAVVLIPPESVWPPIQALRKKHDAKFERWMPHVTLLYPFLPEEDFDTVAALLGEAARSIEPFQVTLSDFDHFDHRASATAWLRPEDAPRGALTRLHAKLVSVVPECAPPAHGFHPHLSVGQVPHSDDVDVERTVATWARGWRPLSFEVREVCIIRRQGNTPFEVVRRIPLGVARAEATTAGTGDDALRSALGNVGAVESAPETRAKRDEAVERLRVLCARVGASLHPYGSYLLGTDGEGSDVDAVALGPAGQSREDFARELLGELARSEPESRAASRFVADAAIPLVKGVLGGVSFEVSHASRPEGAGSLDPMELLARHADAFDPAGLRSVLGLADMKGVLEALGPDEDTHARFRRLLRAVKAWARARGLYSHALGYLGGLSWTVLAAWATTRAAPEAVKSDVDLLAHFFDTFATWPWPQPVALTMETARYRPDGKRDLLPIIAPVAPLRNTTRNVSRSTSRILREEWARARELVAQARRTGTPGAWSLLFEPLDSTSQPSTRLRLSADAKTPEGREVAQGWLLGHITALAYRLESDRRLTVRPLQAPGAGGSLLIGLEARDPSALAWRPGTPLVEAVESFRASFLEWAHRPDGATLQVELSRASASGLPGETDP
ncbi:poly(A) polymerase [Myxococcus fulvus]|uniref:poly(A) polymerase n=1 Tax=Myxococcus fulvus TaxID=33 RepID=UPI0020BE17AD|nr:poly(A) polymerase [Myxococcus fulvus]MCK8501089.1 RNA repair domain-containing protein [Myxococcus fulvus]